MPSEIVQAMLDTNATLTDLGVPVALMGGLAMSAWKHFRATRDVDLLIGVADVGPAVLERALLDRGYMPNKQAGPTDFDGERVLQLNYYPAGKSYYFRVDLFFAESEYHRAALARRVPFHLPDGITHVMVLTCEDLILFKLRAERPVDQGDIVALLENNRATLEFDYLDRWLTAPPLRRLWTDCWRRAFPGDPDPIASS